MKKKAATNRFSSGSRCCGCYLLAARFDGTPRHTDEGLPQKPGMKRNLK